MTIRTFFFTSFCVLASCGLYAQAPTINPNSKSDIQLATDYLNALVSGEVDKIDPLVADDFWSHGPAWGDSLNTAQVKESWSTIANQRTDQDAGIGPTLSVVVPEGPTQGTWVLVWGTYTGTDTATQTKITVPYHMAARVKDGKIQASYRYFDILGPSEAMGLELKPKQ